jgi:DNA-binding MarR family transcriptional regulator
MRERTAGSPVVSTTDGTPLITTLVRRLHLDIRRGLHAELVAAGHGDLAPAHMYVFQTPGPDGARPSELAARTNMTKQAMNHLLATLEDSGYLTRQPAPEDRRATVVRLTSKGRSVEHLMLDGSASLERDWAAVIGAAGVEALREALRDLDARSGPAG